MLFSQENTEVCATHEQIGMGETQRQKETLRAINLAGVCFWW